MKRVFFILVVLVATLAVSCTKNKVETDLIDFEELQPGTEGFWNGSGGEGEFISGNAIFVNHYNADWQSWSGFSYSNHTDTETGDFTNQYSSVAGSGDEESAQYATFYYSGMADTIEFLIEEKITNISVCNSTYAYKVMLNGNDFSKKYGGQEGTDPDWLLLRVSGLGSDLSVLGSVDIYLADLRSDYTSEDFISNTWTKVDLSGFGFVSKLVFEMASSDTGQWGINTPAFVCLDNIEGELLPQE